MYLQVGGPSQFWKQVQQKNEQTGLYKGCSMKKNSSEKINILINSMITAITYTVFQKNLDPLLFHHIFALTGTNCTTISRST